MTSATLTTGQEDRLRALAGALIDQQAARVVVAPYRAASGFWFGGGSLRRGPDGNLWLAGRYRNYGDSRTGLAAGERGMECALYVSRDEGASFEKVRSWSKAELSYPGNTVLSIEGTSLHFLPDGGCELYISSEKDLPYPEDVADFQKPTTGIWTIDVMKAPSVEALDAGTIAPALGVGPVSGYLHVKDPSVFTNAAGDTVMLFCSHPFCWTSSNTGVAVRPRGEEGFCVTTWQMLGRGPAWDVAVTRVTNRLSVPRVGVFADVPPLSMYFYDGAECVREHEQSSKAVSRARGYSCEEIGGVAYGFDADFPAVERLSALRPMFVSPWGTGCSRYVDTQSDETGLRAIWQRSAEDLSQPSVINHLSAERVAEILA